MRLQDNKTLVFFLCWTTYVFAYLCRVNLSSVMYKLESSLNAPNSTLGIIGGLFFITYAVSQLINGFIGDRVSPYKFLMLATLGTSVLNMCIALSDNYYLIMLYWALNGYFQSMFWGPLMRILSLHFSEEAHVRISNGMITSMVTGFVFSWVVLGWILVPYSWKLYFIIPSVGSFIMLMVWILITFKNRGYYKPQDKKTLNLKDTIDTIISHKLWMISLACVCLGLIRESISLWAPLILIHVLNVDIKHSFLLILIIPITNFMGIMVSQMLSNRFAKNIRVALIILFSFVVVCSLILFFSYQAAPIVSVVMIAAISAMTYGCNSIVLSFIPLSFSYKNIVSTLVGVFDFSSYFGAAISSFVLGILLSTDRWPVIPLIWLVAGIMAIGFCWMPKSENKIIGTEVLVNDQSGTTLSEYDP